MWSMTTFTRLRRLPRRGVGLLVRAVVALAIARIALAVMPFRVIVRALGLRILPASAGAHTTHEEEATRIGWAVRTAAAHTPWSNTCLVQALAAVLLLSSRGIRSSIALGVSKAGEGPADLIAHAWVRSGDVILTGETGHDRFVELVTFTLT